MHLPINFNLEDFKKREKIQQALEERAKQSAARKKKIAEKVLVPLSSLTKG